MVAIDIRSLRKERKDKIIIPDLDLRIEDGEMMALIGPSGSGKTTILKMLGGFVTPTSGDILFEGRSILDIPPEKRRISLVFQRYKLFPHMTVADNIAFGLKMQKVPMDEIRSRVAEMIDIVKLNSHEKKKPHQLSGGEQQRVALARAVVVNPDVLLLDEPLSNLDAVLREDMRIFISKLQKSMKITTIMVTHDIREATMADRIAVMFNGVIHQCDIPEEIFTDPATEEVSRFTGHVSVVDGKYVSRWAMNMG